MCLHVGGVEGVCGGGEEGGKLLDGDKGLPFCLSYILLGPARRGLFIALLLS